MAGKKVQAVYMCQQCGYSSPKWLGKCSECGSWNSMVEEVILPEKKSGMTASGEVKVSKLSEITVSSGERFKSGIAEFDRVLGGGLMRGSLVLVGGDPGIGKSTLMLQAAKNLAENRKVLYVSGEESDTQVKIRADRLGLSSDGLYFLGHTAAESVIKAAETSSAEVLIIDSIQTMFSPEAASAPGSVSQVRECCMKFMEFAKKSGIPVILIGHVTKEGNIAGPRILEHMVDCVLYFEGDRFQSYRILRAVKNRFGSTNEIGVFEMTETGLAEVKNPSFIAISDREENPAGSVVLAAMEGTRPILSEIQTLATKTGFGTPRRMFVGTDYNRTTMNLAVLEKKLGLDISSSDIYISVAGGIKISEPAADLPLMLAVFSAVKNLPLRRGVSAIGEVGLTGEVRFVSNAEKRLSELEKMGFTDCVLPAANKLSKYKGSLNLYYIKNISELTGNLFKLCF
ncbi:MAG: DNA repair protein RadA [Monoglobales bacterium]